MSLTSSNVTSGFIDLATYDELEKYMYGGQDATAYFVRETRKSTWFTQVPVALSRASGTPGFNSEWSVQISRAGDYLLNTWLRVTTPALQAASASTNTIFSNGGSTNLYIQLMEGGVSLFSFAGYTGSAPPANGMEIAFTSTGNSAGTGVTLNVVSTITGAVYLISGLTFTNPIGTPQAALSGNFSLTDLAGNPIPLVGVTTPPGSVNCMSANFFSYKKLFWTKNLMHNLIYEASITFNDLVAARFDNYHLDFWSAFTVPASKREGYDYMIGNNGVLNVPQTFLPATVLNLPLPFFFARDSGVALPTAAIPYNDMRINFSFRDWTQLLSTVSYGGTSPLITPTVGSDLTVVGAGSGQTSVNPVLGTTQVWANYAIVSNDERKKMACAPRDILIEQVQTAPRFSYSSSLGSPSFDIRFSQAVKALFFAVRNIGTSGNGNTSIWSNYTATNYLALAGTSSSTVVLSNNPQIDPIGTTSLVYENTQRLSNMGSDFFSLVDPWFHAPTIPSPSKLVGYHMYSYSLDFYNLDPMGSTNFGKLTNVSIQPAVNPVFNTSLSNYEFIVTAVNNNIVRISGGALGFPVL